MYSSAHLCHATLCLTAACGVRCASMQELMEHVISHLKAYKIVPSLESGDQLVLLQRRKAPPSTQLYDDQRLVMKTFVVNGVSRAADIQPTFYPGQKIIFHR